MNSIAMGFIIIGIATILTVVGALLCRKAAENTALEEYQGMADPMLNVVATLFSILLGFLVAGAMDNFAATRDVVEQEANRLADIYSLARALPEPSQTELKSACHNYCEIVINDEWKAMETRTSSPLLWDASRRIWDAALIFSPANERETDIHEALITAVQELGENRRSRIVAMRERYSPALWIVVFGGSIILIGCTYMFYIKNSRIQALMVALVALSLYLNVSLLWIYSNPFIGDLKISPAAFELDRTIFRVKMKPLTLPPRKSADDDDDDDDDKSKSSESSKENDSSKGKNSSKGKDSSKGKSAHTPKAQK